MDKSKMREALASLSFTEKIKILEKLRERDRAIAAAGLRRNRAPQSAPKAFEKNED
jgi:hypothetical protein